MPRIDTRQDNADNFPEAPLPNAEKIKAAWYQFANCCKEMFVDLEAAHLQSFGKPAPADMFDEVKLSMRGLLNELAVLIPEARLQPPEFLSLSPV